jgi:large subunit ribosomal protein L30
MSTAQKQKAKPKAPRKAPIKTRAPRKRVVPVKKPAEKQVEVQPVRKAVAPEKIFLLAVRLKGSFGTPERIGRTLTTLKLKGKFNAVLLENNPSMLATLRQAKDYVTWGELKPKDIAALLKERGELFGGQTLTDKTTQDKFGFQSVDGLASSLADGSIALKTLWQKGLKPVFRLHPPSGGFEASTKRPRGSRGELGYRGAEISSLIARMI